MTTGEKIAALRRKKGITQEFIDEDWLHFVIFRISATEAHIA